MGKFLFSLFVVYFGVAFSVLAQAATLDLAICSEVLSKSPIQRQEDKKKAFLDHDTIMDYPYDATPAFPGMAKLVSSPQEGLLTKIMMIRQAQHTIDMSTYIFKTDTTGYVVLKELQEAVKRGVTVRLMVDSVGSLNLTSLTHPELKALLETQGGIVKDEKGAILTETDDDGKLVPVRARAEVVIFNPLVDIQANYRRLKAGFDTSFGVEDSKMDLMKHWVNRRSHDKILLIDGEYEHLAMAIVGGRNIADHYYGLPKPNPKTFNDMEVIIRNDPAKLKQVSLKTSLLPHFDRLYYHLGNKWLSNTLFGIKKDYSRQLQKMDQAQTELLGANTTASKLLAQMESQNYLDETSGFSTVDVRTLNEIENLSRRHVITDPDGVMNRPNPDSISENFRDVVQHAKKSVTFVSPYFYLNADEMARLQKWLDEDPERKLTIITNSISSTDNMPAQALVDLVLIPGLLANPNWKPKHPGQIEIYAFGRIDGVEYGGTEFYGKLHAKEGVVDDEYTLVTTSNGDPRSRKINSEVGFLMSGRILYDQILPEIERLKAKSYLAYSPEWFTLRAHKKNHFKVKLQPYLLKILNESKLRGMT